LAATFKRKAALNFPDMINIRNEAVVEKYAFGLNWLKGNMRMNEGTAFCINWLHFAVTTIVDLSLAP
jgi:hypothetical protein